MAASTVFDGSATIQQGRVWASIQTIADKTNTSSDTLCHGETFQQMGDALRQFTQRMNVNLFSQSTVGGLFIAHMQNRYVHFALDVFGTPELFLPHFNQLCESVAVTAISGRPQNGDCDLRSGDEFSYPQRVVMHNLVHAILQEEPLPMNEGRLMVKVGGKSGCRVSVLQHRNTPVHTMLRWNANY